MTSKNCGGAAGATGQYFLFIHSCIISRTNLLEANPGDKVILDSGDSTMSLIIATGSLWEGLVNFPDDEKLEFIEEWRNKFKNNVVIVGVGIGETVFF